MDAPYYNGEPGDDDPYGDDFALRQEDDCCPSCGARDDEPCQWDCECRTCLHGQRRDEEIA